MRCSRGVTASRSAPPTPRGINPRRTRQTSKSNKPRQFEECNPAGAHASAGFVFQLGKDANLFGVRNEVEEVVQVAADYEVKTPAAIHSALPDITRLVVFLGSQRRVAHIFH